MSMVKPMVKLRAEIPVLSTKFSARIEGSGVVCTYDTLPGNRPRDFNNVLDIFERDEIPYDDSIYPLVAPAVQNNTCRGEQVLMPPDLSPQKSYIVGYAVGLSQKQVVATVRLSAGKFPEPFSPSMEIVALSPDVLLRYSMPTGCLPRKFQHRVALCEGYVTNGNLRILKEEPVTSNTNEGVVKLSHVPLAADREYTLAYFAGPEDTMLCMTLLFRTVEDK